MFIYEGKKKINDSEIVEAFNIVFESAQLPVEKPDVQVWKDSSGIHALIVELISLIGRQIEYCVGCLSCQSTGQCVIEDDANLIAEKMLKADVVCYATPIYYYEMSGQMKTLLDRMNPLFSADYKFRDIYMLSTAADDGPHVADRAVNGLEGWIECFAKAELAGSLFAGGVTGPGEIANHPALAKAYDMGKNI